MTKNFNVLSRPKRSVHGRKLVITEELAQLLANESDTDEDFIPDDNKKVNNRSKKVLSDSNSNCETVSENDESSSDDQSSSTESDQDENENDENSNVNSDTEKMDDNDDSSQVKEENSIMDESMNNDADESSEKKTLKKSAKKTPKQTTNKKQKKVDNDKKEKEDKKKDKAKTKKASAKRAYKKIKQKQKLDEINNENKKILEKLSSRIKQKSSCGTSGSTNKGIYNGPYVRTDPKHSTNKYQMFIISSGLSSVDNIQQNQTLNEKHDSSMLYKIPKDKIPQIKDQTTPWLCSLCQNRPNHHNLGDLYGPYLINDENDESDDDQDDLKSQTNNFKEAWIHEHCAVWCNNVYVKDNKLHGISNAIKTASTMQCSSCKKNGASLACARHLCNLKYHYPCAMQSKCTFNNDNFTILCNKHHSNNNNNAK